MPSAQSLNNMQLPECTVEFLYMKHPQVAWQIQQAWKKWHSLEHHTHQRKFAVTKEHLLAQSLLSSLSPQSKDDTAKGQSNLEWKHRICVKSISCRKCAATPKHKSHQSCRCTSPTQKSTYEKSIIVHIKSPLDCRGNIRVCQGNTSHLQLINRTTWGEGREW